CKEKIGIELNPVAREYCIKTNNIPCYESLDSVPDESIDVIVSNHCLEHTTTPFDHITALYKKLKKGGKIVLVVPLDDHTYKWKPNDINNHLYSFSPMNMGNLLQAAGFKQIVSVSLMHKWVPHYQKIYKTFGYKTFHRLSWIYGTYRNKLCSQ